MHRKTAFSMTKDLTTKEYYAMFIDVNKRFYSIKEKKIEKTIFKNKKYTVRICNHNCCCFNYHNN
ncbi:hypothetical protein KSI01_16570 [Kurthia sibirica]|nr:hypothetical protein KSI01_16570 [Kurthia sibirica]